MASTRGALVVAIDEYDDPKLRRLRAPAQDAEQLRRVLGDPAIGDFDVELSRNEQEPVLREKIGRFFANRTPDDLLVLHISCHGLKDDDGHLYFAATNTRVDHLDWTAVSAEFVNRQMEKSRSRRVLLLLDCCFAGAFSKGMAARAGTGVDLRERFEGRGRAVLTASSAMEYSFDGDERSDDESPSIFTSAVVKALETGEADRNPRNGSISVDELYDYVYDEVQLRTPKQRPGKWLFDVRGDLEIARTPFTAAPDPTRLPADLQIAIDSPMREARLGAVHLLGELLAGHDEGARQAALERLERLLDDDSRKVSDAAAQWLALTSPGRPSTRDQTPQVKPGPTVRALRRALEQTVARRKAVLFSRDYIADALQAAVDRGRLTTADAEQAAASLLERGREQADNVLKDLERAGQHQERPAWNEAVAEFREALSTRGLVWLSPAQIEGLLTAQAERGRMALADVGKLTSNLLVRGQENESNTLHDVFEKVEQVLHQRSHEPGVGGRLPIAGYDELTAAEIMRRLSAFSSAELREIRNHERRNANRKTILNSIESKLGDRPARGASAQAARGRARRAPGVPPNFPIIAYDDLTARQVEARLWDLTPAELRKVRDYERRHAKRKTILRSIESKL